MGCAVSSSAFGSCSRIALYVASSWSFSRSQCGRTLRGPNKKNDRGRNDSDCARPTGREEACVPRCALIVIRASVHPATGQVNSGIGPEAARNITNQGSYRGRNASDCARPTGREEACVPRCGLIGIRASVHPATGQVSSGIGPEAARNITNQGSYRGRNASDCARRRGLPHSLPVAGLLCLILCCFALPFPVFGSGATGTFQRGLQSDSGGCARARFRKSAG